MNTYNNKNKKVTLSIGLIVVFVLYAFSISWKNGKIADMVVALFRKDGSVPNLDNSISSSTPALSDIRGKYKDGIYDGSLEDVYYGNVQVRATVSNGNLTNVEFLQYPVDRDNSVKISARATPILKTEAIRSQSANVDIVSGATQTSKGFIKSLGTALANASK
jgi:uncharacterized protein with FMN-binding domain